MSAQLDAIREQEKIFAGNHSGEIFPLSSLVNHDILDDLLLWASDQKASDITIQSDQPVWGKIGGRWTAITPRKLSHPELEEIVRCIYGPNGPGELNSGYDLDPSYDIKNPNGPGRRYYRVNMTTGRAPAGLSYQITIRTLPSQPIEIAKLGIEPDIIANFRPEQGLNLICGPTGSGKSTLLSSAIRHLCENPNATEKVIEYSKPVEYVYDGLKFPNSFVHQLEVGKHLKPRDEGDGELSEWAYCVRNSLRRAGNIIIIGEARDKPTIQGCIEVALTGHLLMSTMHTIGVPETISRALMPFPESERKSIAVDMLQCLNMVVTQILIPRVGGGKVGCREYTIFDRKVRAALMSLDIEKWPNRLREMLDGRQVVGSSMADSAKKLLDGGIIEPHIYEYIAARTSSESRLVREARATLGSPTLGGQ